MKRIFILAFILLFAVPGLVSAHSYMEESVPAKDETVTASPDQITMTFNTDIEKLSNFKLYNEAGEEIPVSNVNVEGAVMSGTLTEPLANGLYNVKTVIIGEDGHTVESGYSFTVAAPEQASSEPSVSPAAPSASPETSAEPSASADTEQSGSTSQQTQGHSPNMAAAITIGIIIIAAAVILILRSRKK